MRTTSPYLALALIAGVAAMLCVLIQPDLWAGGDPSDPIVSKKPDITVSNEGEAKAEKIDPGVLEEEKVAFHVDVGPTFTLIQSLAYNPPIGWFFNPFPRANPWVHVDIHNKPPDAILKQVALPTFENDTGSRVRIEGFFDSNGTIPAWPLRCEGNLTRTPGGGGFGGGGGKEKWYWAAKVAKIVVSLELRTTGQYSETDENDKHDAQVAFAGSAPTSAHFQLVRVGRISLSRITPTSVPARWSELSYFPKTPPACNFVGSVISVCVPGSWPRMEISGM
jgi:hypothetical protein